MENIGNAMLYENTDTKLNMSLTPIIREFPSEHCCDVIA